ncbi:NUDIX hydrolase [Clostridium sp.]|jgi:8-oxo-dGTP diphosphatase|uniref:NUDIX hydrolase n=1 Tax=Clostridium sp. TaxID=1506 RepID=UPI003EEB6EE4
MENKKIYFATKALIIKNNKYLALHKTEEIGGLWELPGGRMEFGETAEETLFREVKEEINLVINSYKLLDTWNFVSKEYQITGVIYLCTIKDGNVILSDEHDKYQWLEFNDESINVMHDVFKEKMIRWDIKEFQ